MKRIILLTIALLMFSFAAPVSAEQEITLETFQVQFWPEYDQPAMLVIYTLELPEDTPLPVNLEVKIPAAAGEPHAVALSVGGSLVSTDYTREVIGEWSQIEVVAESPIVQIEYYDPGLSLETRNRSFEFSWLVSYSIKDFIVRVQAPPGASNWSFSDDLGLPELEGDGLKYYTRNFGMFSAGEGFYFSIAYQKSSSRLTIDQLAAQRAGGSAAWLLPLAGFGVVLAAAGGWYLLRGSTIQPKISKSKYAKKRSRRSRSARKKSSPALFCHQCGTRAQVSDKFCRECGQKLRGKI